jgi:putative transposase
VRREAVTTLMRERSFGVTRACGLIRISRSLYRYRSRRPACAELRERICEIAALKRRYGYRRIHIKLRREGWTVNRKLTYRLYREAGLAVRRRKRKRIGPFEREPLPKPLVANDSWSMDFMSDGLLDGRVRPSQDHPHRARSPPTGSLARSLQMACERGLRCSLPAPDARLSLRAPT